MPCRNHRCRRRCLKIPRPTPCSHCPRSSNGSGRPASVEESSIQRVPGQLAAKGRPPHGDSGTPAPGTPPPWTALRHSPPVQHQHGWSVTGELGHHLGRRGGRGAPCRLALVTASGPSARTAATTTGWSGHRTPTVCRADGGPPRSTVKPRRRGTTRVSGPGQYRSARCRAARAQGPATGSTCSSARPPGRKRNVGRSALQREQPVHRAGLRRVDGQPVDGVGGHGHHLIRRPGPRRPQPRAPGRGASEARSPLGHQHPEPPGQVPLRRHRGEAGPAGGHAAGRPGTGRSRPPGPRWCAATAARRRPSASMSAMPGTPAHRPGVPPGPPWAPSRAPSGPGRRTRPRSRRADWTPPGPPGRPVGPGGRRTSEPSAIRDPAGGLRIGPGQVGQVGPGHLQRVGRGVGGPDLEIRVAGAAPRRPATGRWPPSRSRGRRRPGRAVAHLAGGGHPVQSRQRDLHHLLRLRTGDQHPAVDVPARATGTASGPARTGGGSPACPRVRPAPGPASTPAWSTIQPASRPEPRLGDRRHT